MKNAGIVTECRISTTPIQAIIDVLKESEITSGRLGTSLDILPQSWRMALEREMPGLVLCDVSEPLFRIRNHHSPEEVALIRQCGKLADAGYAEVLKNVKPGMTEQQVAAELEHATQGMGADYNFTLISTGRFSLEDNQLPCIRSATMFDYVVALYRWRLLRGIMAIGHSWCVPYRLESRMRILLRCMRFPVALSKVHWKN